jgi:hypothetical protein
MCIERDLARGEADGHAVHAEEARATMHRDARDRDFLADGKGEQVDVEAHRRELARDELDGDGGAPVLIKRLGRDQQHIPTGKLPCAASRGSRGEG